jgi:hypothetical protein
VHKDEGLPIFPPVILYIDDAAIRTFDTLSLVGVRPAGFVFPVSVFAEQGFDKKPPQQNKQEQGNGPIQAMLCVIFISGIPVPVPLPVEVVSNKGIVKSEQVSYKKNK